MQSPNKYLTSKQYYDLIYSITNKNFVIPILKDPIIGDRIGLIILDDGIYRVYSRPNGGIILFTECDWCHSKKGLIEKKYTLTCLNCGGPNE